MKSVQKPVRVVAATILVETSPQAIPLGSACIVSAIKAADFADCCAELVCISYDEAHALKTDAASLLTARIMQKVSAWNTSGETVIVAYSLFVWNVADCIASARSIREQIPNAVLVCGGAEVTARYTVCENEPADAHDASNGRVNAVHGSRDVSKAAVPGGHGAKSAANVNTAPNGTNANGAQAGAPQKAARTVNTQELSVFDYAIVGEGETATVNLIRSLIDDSSSCAKKGAPHDESYTKEHASAPHDAFSAKAQTSAPHDASCVSKNSARIDASIKERAVSPHDASCAKEHASAPHDAFSAKAQTSAPHDASINERAVSPHDAFSAKAQTSAPHDASIKERAVLSHDASCVSKNSARVDASINERAVLSHDASSSCGQNPTLPRLIRGIPENCRALTSPYLDGTLDPVIYNGVLWELSRGCPFACSYCFESKGEKTVRKIPFPRIEKELDFFAQKKVPQLFVLDPMFNSDKARALKLLRLMEQKLPDAHYRFEVRAEFMDKDLVEAFSHLPCSLQIGLQSANPRTLKAINRTFDAKTFSRKIALLNDYGIVFGFDLIYGLPLDTFPSFRESLDYALSLYPNHIEIFRLSVLPGTRLYDEAESFGIKADAKPPYHVQVTPRFSSQDLAKAEQLAFACTVFYSAGRAVPWFLSILKPLKIRPSQFFADFAEWLRCNNCAKSTGFDPCTQTHAELERMQLSFLTLKYEEKHLEYAIPAVKSVVCLNGALSRVVGEGEESSVESSYHPDDIFSGQAMDILAFVEETCMERCIVSFFEGTDGPDYRIV